MADRGDTHYSVPTLNKWFLASSALLLVSTAWMVIDDWNSSWKQNQAEFRHIETTRTRAEMETATMQAQADAALEVQGRLDEARAALAGRQDELDAAKEALRVAKGEQFTVSEGTKKAKQDLAWQIFLIEEHRVHEQDPTYKEDELLKFKAEYSLLEGESEIKAAAVAAANLAVVGLLEDVTRLEGEMKSAKSGLALLEVKLDKLAPDNAAAKLANLLRDTPGIDFVDPKNKVVKQVPGDLTFELNFTKGARIDMCQTCHQATDRAGFTTDVLVDGQPIAEPYLTHPNLDLFLTAKSAHPVSKFGCTICHRGAGQALDFIRTDHRPSNEEQTAEWQEKHHWHKQHHWDYPMLSKDFTEASCVQCHKQSMEIIADDAPTVSKGFQLFEEKGCYACHKVDWYPTKRRPGPTLKNLQAKLDRTWVEGWIADPKAFRPDTKMPRFFHLSNYKSEEIISKSEWGTGRDMLGKEWNEAAVAAISAFLYESAPKQALPAIPAGVKEAANADRGRETFRVAGCLSCHNLGGYPGQDLPTEDIAFDENEYNDHGPDLRGVATKVDEAWLYNWIKDPASYWKETRMPNLRLTDQEAADITAYFMQDPDGIFRDQSPAWNPKQSDFKVDVLQEMARHFYARLGREELTRRITGEDEEHRWDQEDALLLAVGEKHVAYSGCFSCHEISGFEEMNPIGVELSTWGSKTVDKLAWEFRAKILAHENGWDQDTRDEFKHYRENWIGEKLKNPRVFDEEKVRLPLDRLRMPNFGLNDEEILALSNFVVGLVNDEVQRAEMVETPEQQAMNLGMQTVRQNNCMACHVIEPARVTFLNEDGERVTVAAEAMPLGDANTPPRMLSLAGLQAEIVASEAKYDAEVEEIIFRALEDTPGIGPIGSTFFVEPSKVVDLLPAKGGAFVATVIDYYKNGIPMHTGESWSLGGDGKVGDVDGKQDRSYQDVDFNTVRWTFAPPVLIDEGGKLQRDWFYNFLLDPFVLRPQMRVKMPTFNLTEEEAASIADYFAFKSAKEWPARFTRSLHTATGMQPGAGMTKDGKSWPELTNHNNGGELMSHADLAKAIGIKESVLRAIEDGYQPDIDASFSKVEAYAAEAGFSKSASVAPGTEKIAQRANSYHGDFQVGSRIAIEGVDCFKCHWFNGQGPSQMDTPVSWAPDLAVTRERLRPDWTRDWLWNPALVYPGTAMPGNFLAADPAYQEQFSGSTNEQQINAVLDWLYRLDKETAAAGN